MKNRRLPNFQELLGQYKTDAKFERVIDTICVTEDEIVYVILCDKGLFVVFETDYVSDLKYVKKLIESSAKIRPNFVEVKFPKDNFTDYPQLSHSLKHKVPEDFGRMKKYLGHIGGSEAYYFSFLAGVRYTVFDRLREALLGKR